MKSLNDLKARIINLNSDEFESLALDVFRFQASQNAVFQKYVRCLAIDPAKVNSVEKIPFMPIDFFKQHKVVAGDWKPVKVFESSGTGLGIRSKHYVEDIQFYEQLAKKGFEEFYGPLSDFIIMALLPSYLERQSASLVAMADFFIKETKNSLSGFYLKNLDELLQNIEKAKKTEKKVLLIGVSFALLELAEQYNPDLSGVVVMETGGMKGRRREMIRNELHHVLQHGLHVSEIHSEYGMTELLSQGYARRGGIFEVPAWMRVFSRELNDPFSPAPEGKTGGINVIDLGNIHSCAFIETQDIGITYKNGTFEILGRFDNSEVRGCNLMMYS